MDSEYRLIDSGVAGTPFTMALDGTVLDTFEREGTRTLHLYRRDPPAISLGYFQSAKTDIDPEFCRDNGIDICRRSSGGGAIYCDRNQLIYAATFSRKELPENIVDALRRVSVPLVETLWTYGLEAEFAPANDITVKDRKISGCAQVRRRGSVLQHGTLLLKNDMERMFRALKVNPVKTREKALGGPEERVTDLYTELEGRLPPADEIIGRYVKEFESAFDCRVVPGELTKAEGESVRRLVREKYGNEKWNLKR